MERRPRAAGLASGAGARVDAAARDGVRSAHARLRRRRGGGAAGGPAGRRVERRAGTRAPLRTALPSPTARLARRLRRPCTAPTPRTRARAAWVAGSLGRGPVVPRARRGKEGVEAEAAARRSRASGPQVGDRRAAVGRGTAAAHPGLRVAEQPPCERAARRVRGAPPRGRPAARPPLHPIPSRPEDCVVA